MRKGTGKSSKSSTEPKQISTGGGKGVAVQPMPSPRNPVPTSAKLSQLGKAVPVEAVVKRDVGMGETVKSGLSKDLCTDMVCSDFVGGAVFGVGAAGDFIPLVGAGAMMGSNGHVLVVGTPKGGHVHVGGGLCGESGSAWVTWNLLGISPRGNTQGAQNTFLGPVALLSRLAKLLRGGKVLV